MTVNLDAWFKADKGNVHSKLIEQVAAIESNQSGMFERFVKLAALYDPNSFHYSTGHHADHPGSRRDGGSVMTENVVASNIDTVGAAITTQDIRARVMTDGADWSVQRTSKHLEYYAEELTKLYDVDAKLQVAFKHGSSLKGTGLVYVEVRDEEIRCEVVPPDDVVVDEREGERPKQLHWRRLRDADELIAEFPEHETDIARAVGRMTKNWAGYRPMEPNQVVQLTSWRLPIGKKGTKGYKPGRRVDVVDGTDLSDEEYEPTDPDFPFPFAKLVWERRPGSWYGIGLAERIAGHQRTLNRSNLQIERIVDQNAFVTTYVRIADANLAVKTVNKAGSIVPYKDQVPVTVTPPAVHPEIYKRHQDVKVSASQESGVNQMAQHGTKPGGLDSGRALREYKDQTTQRFSTQEEVFEQGKLDVILLLLGCCKKLGKKAPTVVRTSRFGARKIPWSKVDLRDVKVRICAASTLNRTPAGREQTLIEWAQAGVISTDDFRRLIGHPDLDRAMSLYTAAMEACDSDLEEIADGNTVMPEPFSNLKMCVWRAQQQYLLWSRAGAPEEVLEAVRQYAVQAVWMMQPAANDQAAAGVAPAEAMPPDMAAAAMPGGPAPVAALAPQAMDLMAG